jgi:HK97 family phage major capsid protein
MTEQEQLLLEEVNKKATEAVASFKAEFKEIATKAAEGKMSKADVDKELDAFSEKMKGLNEIELKALSDQMTLITNELTLAKAELKAMKEIPVLTKSEKTGMGTLLRKSLEKEGLLEEIVIDPITGKKAITVKNWDKNSLKIQTKAAIDMTTELTQLPGSTPGTSIGYLTDYKMKDVEINLNKDQHVVTFLPTDPITGEFMGVLVEHTYFDGAAVTTEGNSPVASSIKFKTVEFKVLDYSAKVRVHKNMLKDVPRLESKLNRIIPDSILGALDSAVFSTTGDNSATAWGMYYAGNYTAFAYTAALGDKVKDATIINLIGKMVLQAELDNQDVNTVILHPSNLNGLRHEKDALGNSISDRNIVFNNNGQVVSIWGLNVKLSKKQSVDYVTVMWDQAAEIGILEDVSFEIGTDGDDFSKGFRTIIFTMRAAFGVSKPGAIIFSNALATDLASITVV